MTAASLPGVPPPSRTNWRGARPGRVPPVPNRCSCRSAQQVARGCHVLSKRIQFSGGLRRLEVIRLQHGRRIRDQFRGLHFDRRAGGDLRDLLGGLNIGRGSFHHQRIFQRRFFGIAQLDFVVSRRLRLRHVQEGQREQQHNVQDHAHQPAGNRGKQQKARSRVGCRSGSGRYLATRRLRDCRFRHSGPRIVRLDRLIRRRRRVRHRRRRIGHIHPTVSEASLPAPTPRDGLAPFAPCATRTGSARTGSTPSPLTTPCTQGIGDSIPFYSTKITAETQTPVQL